MVKALPAAVGKSEQFMHRIVEITADPGGGQPRRLGFQIEQLADLPDNGFRHMLCVEAVAFDPVPLPAGESWYGRQSLVALN